MSGSGRLNSRQTMGNRGSDPVLIQQARRRGAPMEKRAHLQLVSFGYRVGGLQPPIRHFAAGCMAMLQNSHVQCRSDAAQPRSSFL